MENLLTAEDVAALLRISKRQVYELSRMHTRSGEVRNNPIPTIRIGSSVRYRSEDVEAWVEKLASIG